MIEEAVERLHSQICENLTPGQYVYLYQLITSKLEHLSNSAIAHLRKDDEYGTKEN